MTDIANIARASAKILLDTKSVLVNAVLPFTYTSGKQGPVYVDIRRLISFPAERSRLMDFAAQMLREIPCDYVAGGETAGIPYAAFIAERLNKPMLYVRKKPKGFGRNAQIEGALEEDGKRVILIEDLQTDGGSKKVFVDALRTAGSVIEHAFVVFHYGNFPQSYQNMKDWGLTLHALTTWKDVIAVAREGKYFDASTLSSVEDFLSDPVAWQERHAKTA
jgi:orotate phosphoribosyltransferase